MQTDLLGEPSPTVVRSAIFNGPDDCYRDELKRIWDDALPLLPVCMLNPSRASHLVNDPTVLTLDHFGKLWGYGGTWVGNLYNWKSPSPAVMKSEPARLGPTNRDALGRMLAYAKANGNRVLVAWGNDGDFEGEATRFLNWARGSLGLELICLGTTNSGAPKHPLARGLHRIPRDQQPLVWANAL